MNHLTILRRRLAIWWAALPVLRRRSLPEAAERRLEPPAIAEFLVAMFAKKAQRNALLGCLEENFNSNIARGFSIRRARRL
jgi:hypothetical protein